MLVIPQIVLADAPEKSPTVMPPQVELKLFETHKTVEVAPGDSCEVKLNGTVTVTCTPGSQVEVTLETTETWGWATITPSTLLFTRSGEEEFDIVFHANEGESSLNIGTVKVFGGWTLFPSGNSGSAIPTDGVMATIDIAPYYRFTINGPKTYEETSPATEIDFEIRIINEGNARNLFSIDVLNKNELSEKGFDVKLSESKIEIPEKETRIVSITIKTPPGTGGMGLHQVIVKVTSESGLEDNIQPKSLTFDISIPHERFYLTAEFYIVITFIIVVIVCCIIFYRWRKKRYELE